MCAKYLEIQVDTMYFICDTGIWLMHDVKLAWKENIIASLEFI